MSLRRIKDSFYRKTKLEKALIFCVFVLVVVIIVLFVCLLISHDNEVCNNPECIRASVHLLDTVNPDADPCEDFYAFACGNFMKNAFSKGQPSTLHALNELTANQLKQIVVESRNDTGLTRTLVYQRKFYKACMDSEGIEKHGYERMFNLLDEVIGGWPILKMSSWPEANFNWKKSMITARKLGLYHHFFFRIEVYQNYTNDRRLFWIRPPSEEEIDSFCFNDTNVEIMHNIAKEFGANSVDLKAELRITNNFAEQLRQIVEKRNNQSLDYGDHKNISIKEINHKLIKFDWVHFLWDLTGIHVTNDDKVVFDVQDYLTDLYYLFLRTPKKIQANYIAWIILSTNFNYLPKKVRDKFDEISELVDHKEEPNISDRCYKLSLGLFNMVAESEYIRRYTTKEKKRQVQYMTDYVKEEMREALVNNEWMDENSKLNAFKRLGNITTYIGWLDLAFNVTKIEELTGFNKVKHFPEHGPVIDMARVALKAKYDKKYSQVRAMINVLENVSSPRVAINAYYIKMDNMLILPAPILQGLIFDINRPYYMNFGALGSVIGHELSHGFSVYYENNGHDDFELWDNITSTTEKRREISECVQNAYNNFRTDRGKKMDNFTSIEENLADFIGINLAYNAYRKWVRTYGGEAALPCMKFTPNQIFWIMASTYMCYEPQLSDKDTVLGKDNFHGTPEFRVVGRIMNSPYFANDFNCPVGSRMNTKEKCRIYL